MDSTHPKPASSPPTPAVDTTDLYRRYMPMVYRRILRFFAPQEAEEVLQEVFLLLVEKGEQFRQEASPGTWLYRIATNVCLNRLRDRSRRKELWLLRSEDLLGPQEQDPGQEHVTFLRELWKLIPEELVMIGIYYYVDGMTHDEIARILGVSRRTVGNRLSELENTARTFCS